MKSHSCTRGGLGAFVALILGTFGAALVAPASAPASASAADPVLEILTVEGVPPKGEEGWKLVINGRKTGAVKLPKDTILDARINWRYKRIETFEIQLTGTQTFKHTHESKIRSFSPDLYFSVSISYAKQPDAVREFMDKHEKLFSKSEGESLSIPYNKPLPCGGSEEQLEAQNAAVQKFFVDHISTLRRVDRELRDQIKLVKGKTAFHKGGKFDYALWRKWLESSVRDPIRKIQKDIRDAKMQIRFFPRMRDLDSYLYELSRAVARRSIVFEEQMLAEIGADVPAADRIATDIEAVSRKIENQDLKRLIDLLSDSLGVDL